MARKPKKSRRPSKTDVKAVADRAEARSAGTLEDKPLADIDPVIVAAEEIKAKMGRPTKYKSEYALIAAALCKRGATDFELAEEFEVTTSTIWRWSCQHEDFCSALRVGKDAYDDRVERSLAQRAVGYTYNTEKIFSFQGAIVRADAVEHVPADIGAAKLWLTNRRPDKWRDVTKHEHGAAGAFDQMSVPELEEFIASESKELLELKPSRKMSATKH